MPVDRREWATTQPENLALKAITVQLEANTSGDLPFTFQPVPRMSKLKIYPGDTALTFYVAQNQTDQPLSAIATYNVVPAKAGAHFNKIQCFCFQEQRLKPHESIEMPILFFLDPDFAKDPKMNDVDTITLSYTF